MAIYLLAHIALRLRNARSINRHRLLLALARVSLVPAADEVPPLLTLAGVNIVLWTMITFETSRYGEGRRRLRHGHPQAPE